MWDILYPFIAERRDVFPSPQGPRDCSRTEGTKFLPLGNLSVRGGCISLCTLTRGSVRPVSQHVFNVSGNSHNKQTRKHVGAYSVPQTSLSTGDTCFEKPEAQIIVTGWYWECAVWSVRYLANFGQSTTFAATDRLVQCMQCKLLLAGDTLQSADRRWASLTRLTN